MLGLFVAQFVSRNLQQIMLHAKRGNQRMSLHAASDMVVRDIQEASASLGQWEKNDTGFIFQSKDNQLDGLYKNHNLYRITGQYDFNQHHWHNKSQALVAQEVTAFKCDLIANGSEVHTLKSRIKIAELAPIERSIWLLNRILS